ncbi:MAG: energy-coupling factor transporter ATPase [Caldicoprobacter sp.]|uniref:energy-coupling factor transporter ATPase n=1 Tax=Caldicoprobacter sp. TaxID=2004500 RepID=UPI001E138D5E|nr:energy-coupling factor transporter ATPase [Clostridia bacterium]
MPIIVEHLTHVYMPGSPFESLALDDVSFEIKDGEFIGLIGHTGSGKSTLVQHLNGLLKPTSGRIVVDDIEITSTSKVPKRLRQHVGLVFQYPEHQLFEETVYQDIAFGPRNLNLPEGEVERRVREAMALVGLDFEAIKDRSPFEISGGQRRRVAIAGVLAMEPSILILDEPTAGLDPKGRDEILSQIKNLHEQRGMTIILVSHSMEDIARLVDRIIVMNRGKIALVGKPEEVFSCVEELHAMGLGIPQITQVMRGLKARGMDVPDNIYTVDQAVKVILERIRGKKNA